jgi:hypothetical protein
MEYTKKEDKSKFISYICCYKSVKLKNMNYIGGLVTAWTAMNMRRKNMKPERPNIFLICWLAFCFGFLFTYLIWMIVF